MPAHAAGGLQCQLEGMCSRLQVRKRAVCLMRVCMHLQARTRTGAELMNHAELRSRKGLKPQHQDRTSAILTHGGGGRCLQLLLHLQGLDQVGGIVPSLHGLLLLDQSLQMVQCLGIGDQHALTHACSRLRQCHLSL